MNAGWAAIPRRRGLAVAATVATLLAACTATGAQPPASSPTQLAAAAPATSSPAATATPTPALTPGPSPTPTPLPKLEATSVRATKAPAHAIAVDLGPSLAFTPKHIIVKAGTVVFYLRNVTAPSLNFTHNMAIGPEIGQPMAQSDDLGPRQSLVFTVKGLTPGTYRIWCTVFGHADQGMVGVLTITP